MIRWLKGLFQDNSYRLVGTLNWTINWTDIGCRDTGKWLLYENPKGKRHFQISHKAGLCGWKKHPGYADVLAWSQGDDWPSGAKRTDKGAVV